MIIEFNTLLGIIGTIMAFIEIWKPNICLAIESSIDGVILSAKEYRSAMVSVLGEISKNAEYLYGEVLKGPQLKTPEEFKADNLAAIERWKIMGLGYFSLISYYLILKPSKFVVVILNKIGKGKAVGGIGLILNIIGLCL